MAQAVSRRPLTAEARVRGQVSPCGICGGQSGTGIDCSPRSSVSPYQYQSTVDPYSYIIWRINNRPAGGSSSDIQSHTINMNNLKCEI
jgi:hypothetical protein